MSSLAEQAQAAQSGLATLTARDIANAWSFLNARDLATTLPKFKLTAAGIIRKYGSASAALAAKFYNRERIAAGLRPLVIPLAPPAPLQQVDASIGWSTRSLWQGGDVNAAESMTSGAAQKMTLDPGRQTILQAVRDDPKARGWARVTQPDACYFCALLASRGAVYKDAGTGGRDANDRFSGDGQFKFHDHDKCIAIPVFGVYQPSAQVREWQRLYRDEVQGRPDPLKTWRVVFAQSTGSAATAAAA